MFSFVLALLRGLPILDRWFQAFVKFYLDWESAQNKSAFRDNLKSAIQKCDQRILESPEVSGKPSGEAGVRERKM